MPLPNSLAAVTRRLVVPVVAALGALIQEPSMAEATATAQSSQGGAPGAAPIALYTDIASGPNSGGENDKGIYLSIFGVNFGSSLAAVKVRIGGVEVDNYRYLGPSRGRPDVQQITVQVGALGNPAALTALPVTVAVNGVESNANRTFMVIPGKIYFVAPNGSDAAAGTFEAPFKTVQKPDGVRLAFSIESAKNAGAYGRVRAGDFVVLRGGTYRDVGFGGTAGTGYFLQTENKSGCPPGNLCAQGGGQSSGPITLMGYPGETAFIDRTNTLGNDKGGGGISSADTARQSLGYGAWWNIVDLKIESGFNDGPINTQRGGVNPLGGHWRVVNNELTADSCRFSTKCRAGAIAGGGSNEYWVGNYGHDVYDKPDGLTDLENHGVYIDGPGSYEIGYNVLARIVGGNGIQIHSGEPVDDVYIHHNIISDVGKHGLNLVEGSRNRIVIWSNVIYNTTYAGVRLGGDLHGLKLYNNTFYNTGMAGDTPSSGALTNDLSPAADQVDIRNNIFWPHAGSAYNRGDDNPDFSGAVGTITNNLWYGGKGSLPPTLAAGAVQSDPQFVATTPGHEDLHLQPESPALQAGTDAIVATVTSSYDLVRSAAQPTGAAGGGPFHIGAYAR
jgi:Right handed beta helix region